MARVWWHRSNSDNDYCGRQLLLQAMNDNISNRKWTASFQCTTSRASKRAAPDNVSNDGHNSDKLSSCRKIICLDNNRLINLQQQRSIYTTTFKVSPNNKILSSSLLLLLNICCHSIISNANATSTNGKPHNQPISSYSLASLSHLSSLAPSSLPSVKLLENSQGVYPSPLASPLASSPWSYATKNASLRHHQLVDNNQNDINNKDIQSQSSSNNNNNNDIYHLARFRRHLQLNDDYNNDDYNNISLEDLMIASAQLTEQLRQQLQLQQQQQHLLPDNRQLSQTTLNKRSDVLWSPEAVALHNRGQQQLTSNRQELSKRQQAIAQATSVLSIECPELQLLWRVLETMRYTHAGVLQQISNQLAHLQLNSELKSRLMGKLYHFSNGESSKQQHVDEEQASSSSSSSSSWIERLFSLSPFRSRPTSPNGVVAPTNAKSTSSDQATTTSNKQELSKLKSNNKASLDEEPARPSSPEQQVYGYEVEYPMQMPRTNHHKATEFLREFNLKQKQKDLQRQVQKTATQQPQAIAINENDINSNIRPQTSSNYDSNPARNQTPLSDNEEDNEITMSVSHLRPLGAPTGLAGGGSSTGRASPDRQRSAQLKQHRHQHRFSNSNNNNNNNNNNNSDMYGRIVTHANPKESWRLAPGQLLKSNSDSIQHHHLRPSVANGNNKPTDSIRYSQQQQHQFGGAERKHTTSDQEDDQSQMYGQIITGPVTYTKTSDIINMDNTRKQQQFMIGNAGSLPASQPASSASSASSSKSPKKAPSRDQAGEQSATFSQLNQLNMNHLHATNTGAPSVASNLNLAQRNNLPVSSNAQSDEDFEGIWHDSPVEGPSVVTHN